MFLVLMHKKNNKYATKVGDAADEHNICHMWQQQFVNLYSSIEYSQDKERFMNRIRINTLDSTTYVLWDSEVALSHMGVCGGGG